MALGVQTSGPSDHCPNADAQITERAGASHYDRSLLCDVLDESPVREVLDNDATDFRENRRPDSRAAERVSNRPDCGERCGPGGGRLCGGHRIPIRSSQAASPDTQTARCRILAPAPAWW